MDSVRKSTDVSNRKELMEEMIRKKNLFNLHKWDYLRKKREEQEVRMTEIVNRRKIVRTWLMMQESI
jgi:hypothetical protein